MKELCVVEYIWLDGTKPTNKIRSKSRVMYLDEEPGIDDFPNWSFDGSSTNQADGEDSDCILKPVNYVFDPLDDGGDYLVLCEVLNPNGTNHESNTRAKLRTTLANGGTEHDPWLGFEQEYTMFKNNIPLGWPEHGFPGKQGPYYCGVGSRQIFGRELANKHRDFCIAAGLIYYGLNAEVMPGQWEYQIGYRGEDSENSSALNICDHTWIARWLMHRISEEYNIHISLENKPIKGDWNGAGMHTNFSTKKMRDASTGLEAINKAVQDLEKNHMLHIKNYGDGLADRLTGLHETSSIEKFSAGNADRSCSVRIPKLVSLNGCGYIEDRRPGANADPYVVAELLISTICK